MAEKTFDELLSGAQTIRDNELPESNTHTLVGEQLVNMVEKNKEESGKKLAISDLASGRGESTTTAMTQAAVTQELVAQDEKLTELSSNTDTKFTELGKKLGVTIESLYDKFPDAKFLFENLLDNFKGYVRVLSEANITTCSVLSSTEYTGINLSKNWQYADFSDMSNIRLFVIADSNTTITLEYVQESVILDYILPRIETLEAGFKALNDSAISTAIFGKMGKYMYDGYLPDSGELIPAPNNNGSQNACLIGFPCTTGQQFVFRGYAYWNALVFVNKSGEKTTILDAYNVNISGDYTHTVEEDGFLYSWSVLSNDSARMQQPFIYIKGDVDILTRLLELYEQKNLPVTNLAKIIKNEQDISNLITEDKVIKGLMAVPREIIKPISWEKTESYTNNRPFSIDLTDLILEGHSLTDITFEFDTENVEIPRLFIEYGSTLGGNKNKQFVTTLLNNDSNRYFYQFILPDLSELGILGDLTLYKVTCQISGEATVEVPHKVNVTNVAYNEYPNSTITELTKRVDSIEKNNNSAINYEWCGYDSMKHVIVKKDGSGDFTTIQEAINSITDASPSNQFDIQVWDDFHVTDLTELYMSNGVRNAQSNPTSPIALFFTKNWVHVRGMGRQRILYVESPMDLEGNSFQYVQVIYPIGNCILKDFYVAIKGGRYAIHQESGGSKTSQDYHATTKYINVIAEHFGNSMYTNGSAWTSCYAQANGTTSGVNWQYKKCKWISHEGMPFYTHANKDFDEECKLSFDNCEMATMLNTTAAKVASGCYFGDLGSNVQSVVNIKGCNFQGFSASSYGNIRGLEEERDTSTDDIRIGGCRLEGHSNTVMCVNIFSEGLFKFESMNEGDEIDVVGGSAYDVLWGETLKKIHGTASKGYAISIRKIYDRNAQWGANSTSVYSLAYRLGNCESSPKTLIVKVNGTDYTINFNENYMTEDGSEYQFNTVPRYTNQEICEKINSQYPELFKATPSGLNKMSSFTDCQIQVLNKTGSVISFGKLLVKDPANGCFAYRVATADEYSKVEAISAEYINDGELGNAILINKALFNYVYFTSKGIGVGQLYTVSENGSIVTTSDKNVAIFENIDGETLKFVE